MNKWNRVLSYALIALLFGLGWWASWDLGYHNGYTKGWTIGAIYTENISYPRILRTLRENFVLRNNIELCSNLNDLLHKQIDPDYVSTNTSINEIVDSAMWSFYGYEVKGEYQ